MFSTPLWTSFSNFFEWGKGSCHDRHSHMCACVWHRVIAVRKHQLTKKHLFSDLSFIQLDHKLLNDKSSTLLTSAHSQSREEAGPDSKYFKLFRPWSLCHNYSGSRAEHSHRQHVTSISCVPIKLKCTKTGISYDFHITKYYFIFLQPFTYAKIILSQGP